MNELREIRQPVQWIQNAKGWGILFIVLGHFAGVFYHWVPEMTTRCFAYQYKYCYSFHVELFFFLSGLTFFHINTPWHVFLKKKAVSLLSPYFIWGIIGIGVYALAKSCFYSALGDSSLTSHYQDINANQNLTQMWIDLLCGQGNKAMGVLWFLFCLFTFESLFYLYSRLARFKYNKLFVIAICFVAGLMIRFFSVSGLPFGLQRAFTLGVFFSIGYCMQPYTKRTEGMAYSFNKLIVIVSLVLLGGLFGILNGFSGSANTLPTFCLFIGTALCSILGWCGVSVLFKNKYMAGVGSKSLGIMLLHKYPMCAFQVLLPKTVKVFSLQISSLSFGWILVLYGVGFLFIVGISVCATHIMEKWMPWCLGRFTRRVG